MKTIGDDRQAELRDRTHLFNVRQTAHGHLDRVGYISLDFDCGEPVGVTDNFDLDVGYIRKGVNRQLQIGIRPEGDNKKGEKYDHPLLLQRICYYFFEHE